MVTIKWFNILEALDSEEEIREFLEGTIQDIQDGLCEPRLFAAALADAAKARFVNQLANETGADRRALCDMFLQEPFEAPTPDMARDVVERIAKAFAVPVPV